MTPIINPLWFYLIDVLTTIKEIFFLGYVIIIIILIAGLAGIAYCLIGAEFVTDEKSYNDMWKKFFLKPFKIISIIAVVLSCLTIFIPKEETMYKMMVANYITYENVDKATDAIKDGVDYVMDKINGDNDKKDNKNEIEQKGENNND